MKQRRPNILWLLSDQHNARATGAASDGYVETPHLDELASRGTTFTNAFCQGPLCMPSRASLLTQRYVADHGVIDNTIDGPADPAPTVIQRIHDAGYHTAALGKMHFFRYPADMADTRERMQALGFDEALEMHGKYGNAHGHSAYTDYLAERDQLPAYRQFLTALNPMTRPNTAAETGRPAHWSAEPAPLADENHPDAWLARQAAQWLADYAEPAPFFLIVGFAGPHDPWDAPQTYVDRYADRQVPLPASLALPTAHQASLQRLIDSVADYCDARSLTPERLREVRRHYYAGVTMLDAQIGRVLAALKKRTDADSTLVVYTSDHGELLGEHGLFTKPLFYDATTQVPLIITPPGGSSRRDYEPLVELTDLTATLLDIADAPPIPDSPGTSLRPTLDGGTTPVREVVRSECEGFGMWRTKTHKIVVDEATQTPVQLFDILNDPDELNDHVDDPASADLIQTLMAEVVVPSLDRRGDRTAVRSGPGGVG